MNQPVKFRDLTVQVGDTLEVTIKCRTGNVCHTGVVIFEQAAFMLQYKYLEKEYKNPLCSYSYNCEFKKIN